MSKKKALSQEPEQQSLVNITEEGMPPEAMPPRAIPPELMPPRPKRSRGMLIFAGLLVLIFGGMAAWRVLTPEEQLEEVPHQPVQVRAVVANLGSITVNTTLTGRVQAADEAAIFASGGEVRRLNIAVGDYVKKGQRLFSLDTTQLQGSYTQAQISRDMAREGVETAQQNLDRMQALYDNQAISVSQLEQAQTALSAAQNQLRQAEAGISAAASSLSLLNFDSPIEGYITEVNIIEGMYPPQTQPAVAVASLDQLEIAASVSEYLIAYLKEGAPVAFKITSLNEGGYIGEIKTVALAPATGTLTYPITIGIQENKDAGIKPGMFAEITLPSNQKEDVLIIPAAALMTKNGQTMVAVLDGENIPRLQEVRPGLNNGELVEIETGLAPGDIVVVKGQHFVIEGEAVIRLAE